MPAKLQTLVTLLNRLFKNSYYMSRKAMNVCYN